MSATAQGVTAAAQAPDRARRLSAKRVARQLVPPALIIFALLGLWQLAVGLFHVKSYVLPRPTTIVHSAIANWSLLFPNLRVTVTEMLLGFGLAAAVGITLGMLLASSPLFGRSILPLVIASQTIPVIAIAPILVIWFGYSMLPRILVTALIAFFPLTVNTVSGVRAVDSELVTLFRSLEASRTQIFRKLTFPSALPYIFSGLKIAATLSVIGATVGEWVGADRGLGYQIVTDTQQLDTARVFASIFLLSLAGIALYLIVACVEWVALPWRHSVRAPHRFKVLMSFLPHRDSTDVMAAPLAGPQKGQAPR